MWPFFYSLAFGLTGAYYAKKLNKNPYIWFIIGCICQMYTIVFIFLLIILKRLFLYFLKKKIVNSTQKPRSFQRDGSVTINVEATEELSVNATAASKLWYYLTADGQTKGPMSFQAFYQDWKNKRITKKTLIWNETLSEWTEFGTLFPK